MNPAARNLVDYVEQYEALPFEAIQIEYRRKLVLAQIRRFAPRRLLEVGCGTRPLFTDLSADIEICVVEPAQAFAEHAHQLASCRDRVNVIKGSIEEVNLGNSEFDMIILSCVLHEVLDPSGMLRAIRNRCSPHTMLHVNVPNARSLHRLLAVAMGLIPNLTEPSEIQRRMQQRSIPYDAQSLRTELSSSGFNVMEEGSFFIKPFTHSQMQTLVNEGFMTRPMLDGLDKLVEWLPDLGSEIWAHARRAE